MAKEGNKGSVRRPNRRKSNISVYSNLANRRRTSSDARSRKRAEYLASLPKSRLKRISYRLNPKRFIKYWFSKQGALMALKLAGLGLATMIVLTLAVFAVFRKDLAISPDELTKRVQSRTTKFYDRTNKVLLFELYKDQQLTFVKPDEISNNMKWATIAIEDKDFYKHGGFDLRGIMRTVINNARGGGKQGASTITQQLTKNVILEDNTRTGLAGYTRKLKELILAIELERSYSKDEILNYYLNAIGYGGTAYGVESAANRYFNKSAKNLTIAESAYIASIPQYPSIYDKNSPSFDPELTVDRQRTVINYMQDQGYITKEEADKAKKVDILASIKPLSNSVEGKKAPHFVDEVIKQLEGKYGANNVRKGGWRITTTIDWEMQQLAEKSIKDNIANVERQNGDNAALVAIDVKTNQILAMMGSRSYTQKGYGEQNAATSNLQYGSSLKPFVYGELFDQGNYGPGSVIPDTPQSFNGVPVSNFDRRYRGNITIRSALAESRNLPAMKAATYAGMDKVIETAKKAGEKDMLCLSQNPCTKEYSSDPFMAIGTGTVKLDQHTAAYATMARGYITKPEVHILKIEKPNGEVVEEWKDVPGTQLYGDKNRGEQIRFLLASILSDDAARAPTFGFRQSWFNPIGIKVAVKTGTTDNQKDGWMMGFSPKLAVGVWTGNHDGRPMYTHTDLSTGPIFGQFIKDAHDRVMNKPQYGWKTNEWFTQPQGIQQLRVGGRFDIFQSWFKKPRETSKKYTMDKVSKKLATSCTPAGAKETIEVKQVISNTGIVTNSIVPDGYDIKANDDAHKCGDAKTSAGLTIANKTGRTYNIKASVTPGKFPLQTVEFLVNGKVIDSQAASGKNYSTEYTFKSAGTYTIAVRITDKGYYETSASRVTPVP